MKRNLVKAEDLKEGMKIQVNAAWEHTRYGVVLSVLVTSLGVEIDTTDPMCRDQALTGTPVEDRRTRLYKHVGQLVEVF